MYSLLKGLFINRSFAVPLFFSVYLLIGLLAYNDYGTTWDEAAQIDIGEVSYHYICEKLQLNCDRPYLMEYTLDEFYDKEYGPAYELLLVAMDELLAYKDIRRVYFMRHLLVFLTFWVSAVFFYKLLRLRFDNWKFALLGTLCLILTPRMFAESFYNSKDLTCVSFYIISAYTLVRFLQKKSLPSLLFHALACAMLVNLRMTGLIMPAITVFILLLEMMQQRTFWKHAGAALGYLAFTILFTIALWPYLWEDPWVNFQIVMENVMDRKMDGIVLYLGVLQDKNQLPWHYLPVWMLITTPMLFTVYFLVGFAANLPNVFTLQFLKNEKVKMDFIFLLLFVLPVGAVLILKSIFYDGWRHMYFVYPAFLLVAFRGVHAALSFKTEWLNYRLYRFVVIVIPFVITFSGLAFYLVKNHPHQYVYTNFLAGKHPSEKFEMDFWGVSYRQALEYVLKKDKSPKVNIACWDIPGVRNYVLIKHQDRSRINNVPIDQATYFLSGGRFNFPGQEPFYEKFKKGEYPFVNEICSIKVDGDKIMRVYRLRE